MEELVSYLLDINMQVHAFVSYDVLEHIYDLSHHFQTLAALPGDFHIVYASSANGKKPHIVRRLQRIHFEAKHHQREAKRGHKECDSLRPYLEVRREMIAQFTPDLPLEILDFLARSTKRLRKDDIERYVDEFLEKGEISYQPDGPTNTCDPYTGN